MTRELQRFRTELSGQDLVEYALIIGLVALAVVLALKAPWQNDPERSPSFGGSFDHVSSQLGS